MKSRSILGAALLATLTMWLPMSVSAGASSTSSQACHPVSVKGKPVQQARRILQTRGCSVFVYTVCASLNKFGKVISQSPPVRGRVNLRVGKRNDGHCSEPPPPSTPAPNPLEQFDGSWHATFSGTATIGGVTRPQQGSFDFTVKNGAVSGDASGTIDAKSFLATLSSDFGIGANCTVTLLFTAGGTASSTQDAVCTLGGASATGQVTAQKIP